MKELKKFNGIESKAARADFRPLKLHISAQFQINSKYYCIIL